MDINNLTFDTSAKEVQQQFDSEQLEVENSPKSDQKANKMLEQIQTSLKNQVKDTED